MDTGQRYRVRRVVSRGTPSYQFGYYETRGDPGRKRSYFRVVVHLGEHETADQAARAWREDIARCRGVERDRTADKLAAKLRKLEDATHG